MAFRFETDCVSSDGISINDMRYDPRRRDITYDTFRRAVGPDLARWAKEVGYNRDLPLRRDWHVSYHRSFYQGVPCYYLCWSAIEFVWVED